MNARARAIAVALLKLAVAVVLTWLVLRKIDFTRAFAIAQHLSPVAAAAVMLLQALQVALTGWRWMLVSRHTQAPLPLGPALRLFLVSLFYNQALPSTVPGDAARVWGAARFGGKREAAVGVFLDRLLTLLALLVLTTASLALLAARQHGDVIVLAPAIILAGCFAVLAGGVLGRARLAALLPGKFGHFAVQVADAVHRLFTSRDSLGLCAISLAIHGMGIAAVWVLAEGMGLALTPLAAFIAVPVVMTAALLPVSVNGWGVREGTMVAVLAGFGIGRTEAATLSVIYGLFQLVLGLCGGIFLLFPDRKGNDKASPAA